MKKRNRPEFMYCVLNLFGAISSVIVAGISVWAMPARELQWTLRESAVFLMLSILSIIAVCTCFVCLVCFLGELVFGEPDAKEEIEPKLEEQTQIKEPYYVYDNDWTTEELKEIFEPYIK